MVSSNIQSTDSTPILGSTISKGSNPLANSESAQPRLDSVTPALSQAPSNQRLVIAKSWVSQWDSSKSKQVNLYPKQHFFERDNNGDYQPSENYNFNNLILGGKFPAAKDPLGGLPLEKTAVMDVLDPGVEQIHHVHIGEVSQILIDINVMTKEEALALRGSEGIDRVIQSNIGGPRMRAESLKETAKLWISGEAPGCSCLICSRVPEVFRKMEDHRELSPKDVLPLTTIPRLHTVVDSYLQPKVKIVLGSQGRIGENTYQQYPSAAVGHMMYDKSESIPYEVDDVSTSLDPKQVLKQYKAPDNYSYAKGLFWENGENMNRDSSDPDQHAFGFIYFKNDVNLSVDEINQEFKRFQPNV